MVIIRLSFPKSFRGHEMEGGASLALIKVNFINSYRFYLEFHYLKMVLFIIIYYIYLTQCFSQCSRSRLLRSIMEGETVIWKVQIVTKASTFPVHHHDIIHQSLPSCVRRGGGEGHSRLCNDINTGHEYSCIILILI